MRLVRLVIGVFLWGSLAAVGAQVSIPAGEFRPLFAKPQEASQKINAFRMDVTPVTNAEFFEFVKNNPQWNRESIAHIYADASYLSHWKKIAAQAEPDLADLNKPVVLVSWFAARAYCRSKQQRLPNTSEWEWVAMASSTQTDARRDKDFLQQILIWYAQPQSAESLQNVGLSDANIYGVKDLHHLIWEWTADFNSVLSTGESRGDSTTDNQFFCGAGAVGSADPSDYASFMRYALRASLQASYSLGNLGFRCVADLE